ncbi:hypothetical protein [Tsukamurella paurometabola]|uniref:Uncharacterized protein n=1 Tax=Tsukamurella paurometabola TaxID=2061 RepID=A0ABS5NJP5_TSUPA|nr:hypothetical protein [Tsukamurella paurometabola]MBS4104524.1 hypothetical protein [Tsukamurella paurometabola]
MSAPDRGRADPAVDAQSWTWDESRALPRRSPFSSRFIRYTTWAYLALILAPLPIAVVIGLQQFPDLVGPALAFVLWMCPFAAFFGVLIAPVMGFVGACVASVITAGRNRRVGGLATPGEPHV